MTKKKKLTIIEKYLGKLAVEYLKHNIEVQKKWVKIMHRIELNKAEGKNAVIPIRLRGTK